MSYIIWIVVGGISGWIASKLMDADQSMGLLANIVVGIIGAIIGGTLFTLLTSGDLALTNAINGSNLIGSIVISVIGSMILIWLLRFFRSSNV